MAPHLDLITKTLLDLDQRKIRQVMIEAPPRHGKSQLATVMFAAWYLGRHPDHRVMVASEETKLARQFSEKIRETIRLFGPTVFGVGLHPKRTAVDNWRLDGFPGEFYAAGIEAGGFTGRGANLIIVDDPIRNAQDALSPGYREKVWNWYLSTVSSRQQADAIVVIIQTRWHQDDLIGRLLKYEAADWTRLRFPAFAEAHDPLGRAPGEALWPQIMPHAQLEAVRKKSTYWWQAMYQQDPVPEGGTFAKAAWFKLTDAIPTKRVMKCRFWDCAATEATQKSDPDYTVGALMTHDLSDNTFYVEHLIRVRESPGYVDQLIRQTAQADGKTVAIREEREPGSSGIAVIEERKRKLIGYNYDGVKPRGKPVSWMPLLVQAESGNVRLKNGPWVTDFLSEVNAVPYGTHDDQMDAVSGAFTELAGMPQFAIPGLVW